MFPSISERVKLSEMTTADYDATTYSKKHVSKPDADAHSAQMADLTKQIDAIKLKQVWIHLMLICLSPTDPDQGQAIKFWRERQGRRGAKSVEGKNRRYQGR